MARKAKGPIEVRINMEDFQRAMAEYPDLLAGRLVELVDDVEHRVFNSVRDRTPMLTGRARNSWARITINPYKRLIVSTLVYMRRLEVGWGVKKHKPAFKIPVGGYAMVRTTLQISVAFITLAVARLAGRSLRDQATIKKAA
jgi:hypothetical protein